MVIEVRRKEKENPSALIRRFTRKIQESGILLEARKKMFRTRRLSKLAKKEKALRKKELREEYQRLKKLGQIK